MRFDENAVLTETAGDLQNGTTEIQYGSFLEACETKSSFYLYVNNKAALLLSKADFTQGTPEGLRQLLQEKMPAKKFKIYGGLFE